MLPREPSVLLNLAQSFTFFIIRRWGCALLFEEETDLLNRVSSFFVCDDDNLQVTGEASPALPRKPGAHRPCGRGGSNLSLVCGWDRHIRLKSASHAGVLPSHEAGPGAQSPKSPLLKPLSGFCGGDRWCQSAVSEPPASSATFPG